MGETLPDLDLRGHRSIPAYVWGRDDLLRLVVADMELAELPPDLGRLTGLTTLDAAHNHLRSVPDELAGLAGLEKLDLRWTPFFPETPAPARALEARGCVVLH